MDLWPALASSGRPSSGDLAEQIMTGGVPEQASNRQCHMDRIPDTLERDFRPGRRTIDRLPQFSPQVVQSAEEAGDR